VPRTYAPGDERPAARRRLRNGRENHDALRRGVREPTLEEVSKGLVYTVQDRSILLPFYKRFFVDPALPRIPASVDPNAITHAGHLINLAGFLTLLLANACKLHASWPYLVAAACLQLYNFCDNADGAHARRVNRCSPKGELLDHGLDMLNVTYIAFISAMALGAPAPWWTALALLIPMACATTYWEQAETGLFSLGLMNQVESVFLLTTVLLVSAAFGVDVWDHFEARVVIMGFVVATTAFGILRNVMRTTRREGAGALFRVAPLILLDGAVLAAAATGALTPAAAVVIGTAGNVFFGVRCLALRTAGAKPRREPGMWFFGLGVVAFAAHPLGANAELLAAGAAATFFGALVLTNARDAFRAVRTSSSST